MLIVVAYDIANPKRHAKGGDVCGNYGATVSYSAFESRFQPSAFDGLCRQLLDIKDDPDGRAVACTVDASNAQETRAAGVMVCSGRALCCLASGYLRHTAVFLM